MSLGVFKTSGEPRSFVMAGYLGSLNSFHSFRENKTALQAHPLVVLMFLLRPRRNVYHMEKQSPQRFTTGILTQHRKTEKEKKSESGKKKGRRKIKRGGGGVVGSLGSPNDRTKGKTEEEEVEQRGPKLKKWCAHKRKAASQGTERAAGGKEMEEREEEGGRKS